MITVHKRTARRFLAAMAGVVLAGTGIGYAGRAVADAGQTELSTAVDVDPESFPRHTAMGDVEWVRAQWDNVTSRGA